ncbi:MAG: arylsulfotransferase family protein [Syntrophorhabdaceae bacterium]|nr:hypothetical protein [Syntrophorhabdaceae bacterium]MDD4197495.1 arylsulfotransferase family protein [Syntrophorhabdaceae bacterium]
MNKKRIFRLVLAGLIAILAPSLALPAANAQTPNAPFWHGTDYGYFHPQLPSGTCDPTILYDPTLPDDGLPCGPTMACAGPAPSLQANFTANRMYSLGINNNPDGIKGLRINNTDKSWDAYTLLSCPVGCSHLSAPGRLFGVLLIDNNGDFVQGWENIKGFPAKLFPGGVVAGSDPDSPTIESPALVRQDWCGKEVWRWDARDYSWPGKNFYEFGTQFHHDYQLEGNPVGYYAPPVDGDTFLPKPNGNVLALANHKPEEEYYYPKGWIPDGHPARDTSNISNFPLVDDAFYIINNKGQITWQWFACDHFDQMGFSGAAKYAIMNIRATGSQAAGRSDWTHFNDVNWLGPNQWHQRGDNRFNPSNIIFDSRATNIIGIVANTDNPRPGGWKKGDIVWRVGPDYGPGTPWESLGYIIGPHHAHIIPKSLPGGGNILVFDNGGYAGWGKLRDDCEGVFQNVLSDYSRVIEFNPTTYEVVWEYKQPNKTTDVNGNGETKGNERKFFSIMMSSAQRLVNGNTFICESNTGRIFEVTKEGETVWEYIVEGASIFNSFAYRAYKVPKDWVPKNMTCSE